VFKIVVLEDLFEIKDPFHEDLDKLQEMKLEVFKNSVQHHFKNCAAYKRICRKNNFNPDKDLKEYPDIAKIPWITSRTFKKSYNLYKNFISVPEDQIKIWYHSSGTSGDPSFVGRDEVTIQRFHKSGIRAMGEILGTNRFDKGIVFGPPPQAVFDLTFSLGMKIWTEGMCGSAVYLMTQKQEEGKIPIDIDLTVKTLIEAVKKQEICNIGGATPLAYTVLSKIHENTGKTFPLNPKSFGAGFGGGWKTFAGQELNRDQFRKVLNKILGIPIKQIRDIYALTECELVFFECEDFDYHCPPWGEVIIRDPETMAPVKEGQKGLINVINPLSHSWPGISILLDDVATLMKEKKCSCGRNGMTFDDIGRAKGAAARGCGAMITDLGET